MIKKTIENEIGIKPILFSSFSSDGLDELTSALFNECKD